MSNREKWGRWRKQRNPRPSPQWPVALALIVVGAVLILASIDAVRQGLWWNFGYNAPVGIVGYGPTVGMVGVGGMFILLGLLVLWRYG
jgi:hypothetical protein